jgi:hypothetical protein
VLEGRASLLEDNIATLERELTDYGDLTRVISVETEYLRAVAEAELSWVGELIDDLRTGALTWSYHWRRTPRDPYAELTAHPLAWAQTEPGLMSRRPVGRQRGASAHHRGLGREMEQHRVRRVILAGRRSAFEEGLVSGMLDLRKSRPESQHGALEGGNA